MNMQNFWCSFILFTTIIVLQFSHFCFRSVLGLDWFFNSSSINTSVLVCIAIFIFIPGAFMWCRFRCLEIFFSVIHLPHVRHSTFFKTWLVSKEDIFCVQNQTNVITIPYQLITIRQIITSSVKQLKTESECVQHIFSRVNWLFC